MCFILTFLSISIFLITYLVNFFIVFSYRHRLADCLFKEKGILRNFFIVHPLEVYLSSFLWGIITVLTFLEFFVPPKPLNVAYFLLTLAVAIVFSRPFREVLLKYTNPQVSDYLVFRYFPFAVSILGAILYTVYLYNFATLGDLVSNPNAEEFLKQIYSTYGGCQFVGPFIVFIKLWDYTIGSLLINSAQLGEKFFLPFLVFTFFKTGVAIWILIQTVLGTLIVLKRVFGLPFWV